MGKAAHALRNDWMMGFLASIGLTATSLLLGCDHQTHTNGQSHRATASQADGNAGLAAAHELYEQRKFAEAIPYLKQALDKSHQDVSKSDVLTMIGNCYNELEQYDVALEYHNQAARGPSRTHSATALAI